MISSEDTSEKIKTMKKDEDVEMKDQGLLFNFGNALINSENLNNWQLTIRN